MTEGPVLVVVVDDSVEIRELLRLLLGLDERVELVGEACNGRDGVELVAELQPDVVLLDMEMPVLNGMEALRELVLRAPRSKVVMFSSGREELEAQALAEGAYAFRTKGSDLDELVDLVVQLG
jgi:chemotaxis response regulator CheB